MPNGEHIDSGIDHFGNWTVGVNFSVPLGLRQGRAQVRQQELTIARDQANLDQGLHGAIQDLATTVRGLESAYEQYLAYKTMRAASYDNLKAQFDQVEKQRRTIYLNYRQALVDWGNAVTSEAQSLLTYNVTLALLERQTGTILDTHGLVFAEERYRAAGPLSCLGPGRLYPASQPPIGSPQNYPGGKEPSEKVFDLRDPASRKQEPTLPPPRLLPQDGG
jgi:hypothetical protein